MDRNITVRHVIWALGLYAGYVLLKDHFMLSGLIDFMSQIKVV